MTFTPYQLPRITSERLRSKPFTHSAKGGEQSNISCPVPAADLSLGLRYLSHRQDRYCKVTILEASVHDEDHHAEC